MNEEIKCEGCGAVHVWANEVFEDVMGNPRCNVCLPGLDDDEYDGYDEEQGY